MHQDVCQRIHVEAFQRPVLAQRAPVVADSEIGVLQPDVCFDACASCDEGVVERNAPPVVVVGVTGNWGDVSSEIWSPSADVRACRAWFNPFLDYLAYAVGRDWGGGQAAYQGQEKNVPDSVYELVTSIAIGSLDQTYMRAKTASIIAAHKVIRKGLDRANFLAIASALLPVDLV